MAQPDQNSPIGSLLAPSLIAFFVFFILLSLFVVALNLEQIIQTFSSHSFIPIHDFEVTAYFVNYVWLPNIVAILLLSAILTGAYMGIQFKVKGEWNFKSFFTVIIIGIIVFSVTAGLLCVIRPYSGERFSAELRINPLDNIKNQHMLFSDSSILFYSYVDDSDPNQVKLKDMVLVRFVPYGESNLYTTGFGIYQEGLITPLIHPNKYLIYLQNALTETLEVFPIEKPVWEIPKHKVFTPVLIHSYLFSNHINQSNVGSTLLWSLIFLIPLMAFALLMGMLFSFTPYTFLNLSLITMLLVMIPIVSIPGIIPFIHLLGLRLKEALEASNPNATMGPEIEMLFSSVVYFFLSAVLLLFTTFLKPKTRNA